MPRFEFAYSIEDTGDSLRIVIRNRTDQLTLVWSAGGLAIMMLAEVLLILAVFVTLRDWDAVGVLVSVAGVFVVGYSGLCIFAPLLMWQLGGQETVIVGHRELKITRSAFGHVRQQTYRMEQLEGLKAMSAEHDLMYRSYRRRWIVRPASVSGPFRVGRIGFNYGGVTQRFGSGLVPAEAEDIVDRIHEFRRRHDCSEANRSASYRAGEDAPGEDGTIARRRAGSMAGAVREHSTQGCHHRRWLVQPILRRVEW